MSTQNLTNNFFLLYFFDLVNLILFFFFDCSLRAKFPEKEFLMSEKEREKESNIFFNNKLTKF